jgi:hypothetical protein
VTASSGSVRWSANGRMPDESSAVVSGPGLE